MLNNNKGLYIAITIVSLLIIIFIIILYYIMYKNKKSLFASYDPNSNKYIVSNNENGLQYINIPQGSLIYIDSSSSDATKKQTMITKALSSLNSSGITDGYVETESIFTDNNISIYIILIIFIIIVIGFIACYAAINEN